MSSVVSKKHDKEISKGSKLKKEMNSSAAMKKIATI
jgi:hypothetical protein